MPATPTPPFHRFGIRFTSDPAHNKSYLQGLLNEDHDSIYRGELFINEALDQIYYADTTETVRRLGERSIPVLSPATSSVLGGVKVGTGVSVTSDGTISVLGYTLPAATSSVRGGVKIGTGVTVTSDGTISVSGSGGNANTGDITFADNYIVGTGTISGGSGLFLVPGPDFIDPDNLTTYGTQYVRLRAGDNPSHIHFDTGNNASYDWYFGDDSKYVMLSRDGSVRIQASSIGGVDKWVFNPNGTLKLAGGSSTDDTGAGTYLNSKGTISRTNEETQVTIFTASQVWMTTVKLIIQAESTLTNGGNNGWDTQATELLIIKSVKGPSAHSVTVSNITTGGADNDIFISNYFVSLTNGRITVNAEPINNLLFNGASTDVYYSVCVVEMYSND